MTREREDDWPGSREGKTRKAGDPRVKRLDEGLHDLWDEEDHSDKDLHRIQELGLYID